MKVLLEEKSLSYSNTYEQLILLQVITTNCSCAIVRKDKIDPSWDQFPLSIRQTWILVRSEF